MRKFLFSALAVVGLAMASLTAMAPTEAQAGFFDIFQSDEPVMTVERINQKVQGEATWAPVWVVKEGYQIVAVISERSYAFEPVQGDYPVMFVADVGNMYSARDAAAFTGAKALYVNGGQDHGPGVDGIFGTADDVSQDPPNF